MKRLVRNAFGIIAVIGLSVVVLSGCAPKVGSEAWCSDMKDKPQGDWTINEAADFAKFCVLQLKPSSE